MSKLADCEWADINDTACPEPKTKTECARCKLTNIDLILQQAMGFRTARAVIIPGSIARIPGNRFVAGSWSERRKYARDDIRITVGIRTICVYIIDPALRQACRFQTFQTAKFTPDDLRDGVAYAHEGGKQ